MKLLIVDDSMMMRKMIERALAEKNFTVVGSVGNGEDALEIFKKALPDLVTLDITMPKMDGITAMTEMLKIKNDAKILMVSSLADKATASEAMEKGAAGILPKPFTTEQIIQKVNEVLGQ
jgi:two-component system chemotaxis response regulator CheY